MATKLSLQENLNLGNIKLTDIKNIAELSAQWSEIDGPHLIL